MSNNGYFSERFFRIRFFFFFCDDKVVVSSQMSFTLLRLFPMGVGGTLPLFYGPFFILLV